MRRSVGVLVFCLPPIRKLENAAGRLLEDILGDSKQAGFAKVLLSRVWRTRLERVMAGYRVYIQVRGGRMGGLWGVR